MGGWLRLGLGSGRLRHPKLCTILTPRLIRSLAISTSPYDADFSENIKFLKKRNEHNVYTTQTFRNIECLQSPISSWHTVPFGYLFSQSTYE